MTAYGPTATPCAQAHVAAEQRGGRDAGRFRDRRRGERGHEPRENQGGVFYREPRGGGLHRGRLEAGRDQDGGGARTAQGGEVFHVAEKG